MAAKTGSAESSMGGEDVVHGWITGFAPAEKPEYTITVFIEDGESGSGSAGPIFAQIAQYLSDSKSFEQPFSFKSTWLNRKKDRQLRGCRSFPA